MAPPSGDDGALDERATTLSGGMERHSTTLFERQATTLDAHGSLIGRRSTDGQMERRSTDFMLSPQATAVRDEAWPAPPPPAAEPPAYAPPADLPPPAWLGACGDEAAGAAAGSYEDAGKRASMEDTELVIPRCCGAPGATLLGIFDGHRGPEAAAYLRDHLHRHLAERWTGSSSAEALLSGALLDANEAFNAEWADRLAASGAAPGTGGESRCPGSTALVALVYPAMGGGWRLAVANVGDSRAVACQGGQATALTSDHTGARLDERERVHKAGAYVRYLAGAWRFGKRQGLAVTRSIGDVDLKGVGISAQAETKDLELDGALQFVILASDGVWDLVSNEDGVALIKGIADAEPPGVCAERLVKHALERGSTDNASAVVAILPGGGA